MKDTEMRKLYRGPEIPQAEASASPFRFDAEGGTTFSGVEGADRVMIVRQDQPVCVVPVGDIVAFVRSMQLTGKALQPEPGNPESGAAVEAERVVETRNVEVFARANTEGSTPGMRCPMHGDFQGAYCPGCYPNEEAVGRLGAPKPEPAAAADPPPPGFVTETIRRATPEEDAQPAPFIGETFEGVQIAGDYPTPSDDARTLANSRPGPEDDEEVREAARRLRERREGFDLKADESREFTREESARDDSEAQEGGGEKVDPPVVGDLGGTREASAEAAAAE